MGFLKKLFGGGDSPFANIDVNQYQQDYYKGKADHILVDVRSASEFSNGHIPGAINIPLHDLASRSDELPTDKPIVVVCASGNRSRIGSKTLVNIGHTNISNLQGGTSAWMQKGLPVE